MNGIFGLDDNICQSSGFDQCITVIQRTFLPFSNYTLKYLAIIVHHAFKLLLIEKNLIGNVCLRSYTCLWKQRKKEREEEREN